jgi:membrane protein
MLLRFKKTLKLFRYAGEGFIDDNAFKLSAALSYYTVFALAPLLIIIISLFGIFFGKDDVRGQIYEQMIEFVGPDVATQMHDIILNIQNTQNTTTGAIIGLVVLFVAATTVFTEMQDSINYIWSVKAKPKKSWLKFLINRLLSFSLVVAMGFLMLVSLVINALLALLSNKLAQILPDTDFELLTIINNGIFFLVITGLFAVIFKILPDAIIAWKDSIVGATLTAVLFLIGKLLIAFYLGKVNFGITYGAAASIIIIMIWVYYSAMILYFGAEFTKMYALHAGTGIRPKETAVFIIKRESKEVPVSYLDT